VAKIKARVKERFSIGEELVIDDKHLNKKTMELIEEIKEQNNAEELEGKSVDELKAYAEEHGIDIGKATTEEGIIKKIKEATEKAE
jgi:Lon protease-like protein